MTLRDLSYLLAVAEFRNFSQAAEHCAISQPTLSTQIKKLEDYLGVDLFLRDKNNVAVTDACREILTSALHRNQLSLGAFPSLASYVLPECVP